MERVEATQTIDGASCDLPQAAFGDRIAAWKDLGRAALDRTVADGRIVTTYPKDAGIRHRLTHLIEAEARCCPFLVFDVRETTDTLEVEVSYPPEFAEVISAVLA